jgi:hypothetical protein
MGLSLSWLRCRTKRPPNGGFFIYRAGKMRTIVYIDGFNFYFGVLRGTDYKWLDIVKLVKHICHIQNPDIDIIAVKFFTAPVMTALATRGDKAGRSQDAYHRALKNSYPNTIEIINGFYVKEKATPPRYKKPADKLDRVEVWKLEEKQTDVNIALHLYRDAILKNCECSVLVSSDSDIEPALHFLCQDFPEHHIGLILPRRQPTEENEKTRPANASLSKLADWTRSFIRDEELKKCQFPPKVPTQKKPAIKPDYW